jgi:hypothetical protein
MSLSFPEAQQYVFETGSVTGSAPGVNAEAGGRGVALERGCGCGLGQVFEFPGLQGLDLVPEEGRFLEVEPFGGLFHSFL